MMCLFKTNQSIFLQFKSSEMAYNVIARAVINDCQSDDMRFGGMEINN